MTRRTRRQLYIAGLVALALGTTAARAVNWPSVSGTTAPGMVLEDGAGNKASISGGTIVPVVSPSAEGSRVFCAAACNLWSIYITTGASAGFLMTFNATSAPAEGAVTPIECVQVAANSTVALSFGSGPPDRYSTGATAVFSTTGCFNKTISATAFFKARTT